jgi:Ca2+-binding EF-hand superfamily protein
MKRFVLVVLVSGGLSMPVFVDRLAAQDSGGRMADDVQDLIVYTDARPLFVRMHVTIGATPFRQVWRENLIKVFGELDRDFDGVLNKEEASRVPALDTVDVRARLTNPRAAAAPAIAADSAGNVSRDAFFAHFEKSDAAPFSTRVGQGQSQLSTALFALLDTNRDQRLSAEELRAAESSLRRRDYDDDEIIVEQEIVPGQNSFGGAIVVDRAFGTTPGRSPFVFVVGSGNRTTDVADALLARYDTNKDAKLSVSEAATAELRLNEELCSRLDLDKNQSLNRDELGRFIDRLPDIELSYKVDPRNSAVKFEPVRIDAALSSGYPTTPAAELKFVVNAGDALLEFRRADSSNAPSGRQVTINQFQFQNLDSDNNGYIDENEARRFQFIGISIKAMDRDGDGKVFKEEFEAYNQRQAAAAATRISLEVTDDGQQLLELIDKDRDNRLTLRELRAAADLLEKSDSDHDGSIAGAEIPRRLRLELTRGTAASNARQVIAFGGVRQQPARPNANPAGPTWFRRMDRNHDGDLSPREFLGPRDDFDRLDANHDGLIDAKEAEAAADK